MAEVLLYRLARRIEALMWCQPCDICRCGDRVICLTVSHVEDVDVHGQLLVSNSAIDEREREDIETTYRMLFGSSTKSELNSSCVMNRVSTCRLGEV